MIRIEELLVSEAILEKLAVKHDVAYSELEEACLFAAAQVQIQRNGRDGTLRLFSRAYSGRYLFIVLSRKGPGLWRVVTARDMTVEERREYLRHA